MSIVVNGITTKNVVFNGKDVKKVCNETDKIIFTKTFGKTPLLAIVFLEMDFF